MTPYGFPWLKRLNLSENKFVSLPSFSDLSNLSNLNLSCCELLQKIPELPESLKKLNASDCKSLVQKHGNIIAKIISDNKAKVISSNLRFLKDYEFEVTLPGDDSPDWFSHKSLRDFISFFVPSNFLNNIKAVIVCLKSRELPRGVGYIYYGIKDEFMIDQTLIRVSHTSQKLDRFHGNFPLSKRKVAEHTHGESKSSYRKRHCQPPGDQNSRGGEYVAIIARNASSMVVRFWSQYLEVSFAEMAEVKAAIWALECARKERWMNTVYEGHVASVISSHKGDFSNSCWESDLLLDKAKYFNFWLFLLEPEKRTLYLNATSFNKMKRLWLLIFDNVVLSTAIGYLSNELRLIDLPGYQFPTLPFNSGRKQLVILNMPHNHIHQLDKEFKNFERMRVLNFSHSKFSSTIPDLSTAPNLESLHVDHCTSLVEIHESVGFLSKLVTLDAQHCSNLSTVPKLPSSIDLMVDLSEIHLAGCKELVHIPNSIFNLVFLDVLDLNGCIYLSKLPNYDPEIHGNFELSSLCLKNCNISNEHFLVSPFSFPLLECLDLSGIPDLPERQINVQASHCISLVDTPWKIMANIISNGTVSWFSHMSVTESVTFSVPSNRSKKMAAVIICAVTTSNEIMIERKRIKVSDSISRIIDRTFDDFANGGTQFSWSSRQKRARKYARTNIFGAEDLDEEEEAANISETYRT
ncbi:hypothetical protein FEM48_Zijuj05G0176900 [Ziziphus jujuba var. spinosa]|uniref:Uncharacterized protein n=1 Tax=Ziziphus jujuba var. spinosa TaxID=714518 RepID=A0A978VG80_ZIZJJ|nr:hypothetical protein FEM48_Zijuj05G0176900 [Ziziphus jujuba var. spinosa]